MVVFLPRAPQSAKLPFKKLGDTSMDQLALYDKILQLKAPWKTIQVNLDEQRGQIYVEVACHESKLPCPKCNTLSKRYDSRKRRWRHLDTCQFQTLIEADVPRIQCEEHGCLTLSVPWAQDSSRYTQMFETQIISWASETSTLALTRQLNLSWNAIDGILKRAVNRGLKKQKKVSCLHLFVDETCIAKPRDFITVLSNQKGQVLAIADGRSSESLLECFSRIPIQYLNKVKSISMDLSAAFKKAVQKRFGRRYSKLIAYDHFHIAKILNEALNHVRTSEVRAMPSIDQLHHYKTRFIWLKGDKTRTEETQEQLNTQSQYLVNTSTVWYFKEQFRDIWHRPKRIQVKSIWKNWIELAKETGIRPLIGAAETVERCLQGILNAMKYSVSNGRAEAINNNIKALARQSRGYRNKERYKTAILFHFGKLDMSHTTI